VAQISEAYEIPTICQKLFLHGAELNDNEATAESLDLLAHDVLELHHVTEEIDVDGISDSEADRKKPRDEGRGFNGTVLGGAGWTTDSSMPSSPAATPDQITLVDSKPCNACTFSNSADALSCEICDTIFV
jgi:ubiquitin carboxyl-terminal hydrolase 48